MADDKEMTALTRDSLGASAYAWSAGLATASYPLRSPMTRDLSSRSGEELPPASLASRCRRRTRAELCNVPAHRAGIGPRSSAPGSSELVTSAITLVNAMTSDRSHPTVTPPAPPPPQGRHRAPRFRAALGRRRSSPRRRTKRDASLLRCRGGRKPGRARARAEGDLPRSA